MFFFNHDARSPKGQLALYYLGFIITIILITYGGTCVNEWSAPNKFRHMVTDYKPERRTSTIIPGFETKIQLREGMQTHALENGVT